MPKTVITLEIRKELQSLMFQGWSVAKIAKKLGFSAQTLTKEIRRNGSRETYDAEKAQTRSNEDYKIMVEKQRSILKKRITEVGLKIKDMIEQGKTIFEVVRETGCSEITIRAAAARLKKPFPGSLSIMEQLENRISKLEEAMKKKDTK